jgi:hypothetical protein
VKSQQDSWRASPGNGNVHHRGLHVAGGICKGTWVNLWGPVRSGSFWIQTSQVVLDLSGQGSKNTCSQNIRNPFLQCLPGYQVELTQAIFLPGAMLDDMKTGRFYGEWTIWTHLETSEDRGRWWALLEVMMGWNRHFNGESPVNSKGRLMDLWPHSPTCEMLIGSSGIDKI